MASGVTADGSRFTLGMGTPSRSSPVCDWIRPQATVRGITGRRAGKRALAVRPASRPGILLGCKASGLATVATTGAREAFPLERFLQRKKFTFPAELLRMDQANYARNGTKPARS